MEEKLKKLKKLNETNLILFILILAMCILIHILLNTHFQKYPTRTANVVPSELEREIRELNGEIGVALGNNSTGSSVVSMLENIEAKWRTKPDFAENMTIICFDTTLEDVNDIEEALSKIKTTRRYTVTATKSSDTGLYNNITITDHSN